MTLSAAARAAVLKALLDDVERAYKEVRREADAELLDLYRAHGATNMEARIGDDAEGKLAKLSVPIKDAGFEIDEARLLAWARGAYPEHVIEEPQPSVHSLAPAFRKTLLADLMVDDDGRVIHRSSGVVVSWARYVPKRPGTVSMTFEKHARTLVVQAWRAGALNVADVLALEGGRGGTVPD